MSEASRRMYLTNQGLQLYGKIQTGTTTLQITRVVIGSGTLADDETIAELQTLKDSVDADVKITDYKIVGDGQAVIAISIDAAESDYYLREIGIIADDPDVGEILYSYCNFGEHADYIEKYDEQYPTAQEGIIYTAVGNASELNINISDTLCVTPREFRIHREAETLDHPDGSVTKTKLNDDVFEFAVDTIYDATITQTSDGNAVFNIEIPDVEGYTDLNGKIIAVYTGTYCGAWDNPQKVYISVNGLNNRIIRRSLPTNKTADYDTKNCFTDKFISGEINKYQVLYLYFKGSITVLLNPLSPARATEAITESTSDNSSYITPKHVVDYINTKTWSNNLHIEWNYQGTGEYGTSLPFNCTTPFRLFIPATSNNPEQTIFVTENAPITINAIHYYFETPRIGVYLKIHNGIVEVLTPDEELPEFVYLNPIDIQIKLGIPTMTLAPADIGNLLKSTSVLSQSAVKVSSIINDYGGTRNEYMAEHAVAVGTASTYGHLKTSDSVTSTSGEDDGEAATPYAVKQAYDLAKSKKQTATLVIGTSAAGYTADYVDYLCGTSSAQTQINNAISALPSGGGKIVLLEGTYNCSGQINVNKPNVIIEGMGRGATTLQTSGTNNILNISSVNCKVSDMTIKQINNAKPAGIGGMLIPGAHATIRDVETSGFAYGISVSGTNTTIYSLYSHDNSFGIYCGGTNMRRTISNCTFVDNDYGIGVEGSQNNIFDNYFINNNTGIWLVNYGSPNYNKIHDNYIIRGTGQTSDYTSTQYTIHVQSPSNHNDISNNYILGKNYVNSGGSTNTFNNNRYQ